jgi:hypothetical protein
LPAEAPQAAGTTAASSKNQRVLRPAKPGKAERNAPTNTEKPATPARGLELDRQDPWK